VTDNITLELVPDVKAIMPQIKSRVLEGLTLVFSGVVPLGTDIQNSDIALWAKSFGAKVEENVGKRTTHVIAARNRTAKVRQAAKRGKGRIKIVGTQWLMDSIVQWRRMDEVHYLLKIDEHDNAFGSIEEDEVLSDSEEIASGVETEDEIDDIEGPKMPGLSLKTEDQGEEDDAEGFIPDEVDDGHSPVGGTNEDWNQMHDELAEFLGSDAEDSDNDSLASGESDRSSRSVRGTKRSHGEIFEEASELQQRKRQAIERSTNLSQTELASPSLSGLPTPDVTAGEEGDNGEQDGGDAGDISEGDGWSEFEGDLEAELERAASEELEGG